MTKGLLNEMQRHQQKLINKKEEENNEEIKETKPDEKENES
jgi:hypothetical protein